MRGSGSVQAQAGSTSGFGNPIGTVNPSRIVHAFRRYKNVGPIAEGYLGVVAALNGDIGGAGKAFVSSHGNS
jgi:hypothetical protein